MRSDDRRVRLILDASTAAADRHPSELLLGPGEVRQFLRPGRAVRHLASYDAAIIETPDLRFPRFPFLAPSVMRLLAPGRVEYVDRLGHARVVTHRDHLRAGARLAAETAWLPFARRRLERMRREASVKSVGRCPALGPGRTAFVRTDLVFDLAAGGSVGHIAGVLNNLAVLGRRPLLVTAAAVPTVSAEVDVRIVLPEPRFWDFRTFARRYYNVTAIRGARRILAEEDLGWIYHRYSLGSFAAAVLAIERSVPLVLEYNGSEVWVERNWGGGRAADDFDVRVEETMLRFADVIVVVSDPLRAELVERGIEEDRILANPNGVDPDRYRPDLDGQPVRDRLGVGERTVIGFIGTFGAWHGAEVLAEAYVRMLRSRPGLRDRVHLLMIGDGVRMGEVRQILAEVPESLYTLTGIVPQADAPAYLAACDLFASPHVPNADGSPFFGSPTKLFEYMAMGRGIVASDLDQIGEVLTHGQDAWLVEPGSAPALAEGLAAVVDDAPLRARLGGAARATAVARHTWRAHTQRILDKLAERCG